MLLHYLDDCLNVAYQSCSSAQCQLDIIFDVFRYLRIPIAEEKIKWLTKFLVFLGIELDAFLLATCSPDDELAELKQHPNYMLQSHYCWLT